MGEDEEDPDTEEALAEFDFLVAEQSEGAGEARTAEGPEWTIGAGKCSPVYFLLYLCGTLP